MFETGYCRHTARSLDARFSLKGTEPQYAPDRTFDTEHIKIEIDVDVNREAFTGRATTTLRALTDGAATMVFNAMHFKLKGVRWNNRAAKHVYQDGKITVTAPKPVKAGERVEVEISYAVQKPRLGLYFIKPSKAYPKNPVQVWTQGEDEYARYWFPCHDEPGERTTTELIATVPAGFTAVSNGKLVKASRKGSKSLFHYRLDIPHATYLVTLTVGRFSELRASWRGKPVQYFCEKGREADTRRAFGKTPKMLEFFSTAIGVPYAYPKYAQIAVNDFIYGGMENTSATTQTDTALLDEKVSRDYDSDGLVAHELAHQWFGDYLTCKDWSHAWLNESFATYFDALFKRHDKGEDEFLLQIRQNLDTYLDEDRHHYRRAISTKLFKRPSDLFDRHLYEKGSVVLFMLHRMLGEKLFWKAIKTYVSDNAAKTVESVDLINAVEKATGRNLRRFFDQWIFGAGHPDFKVRAWWDPKKKQANVRVTQMHATGPETGLFHAETELLFRTPKGETREKIAITKKSHLFTVSLDAAPSLVEFDPDHVILKTVSFVKPEAMWVEQLLNAKNMLSRLDAAAALARSQSGRALDVLHAVLLNDDEFWAVRAEAASALGQFRTEPASKALLDALDAVEHLKVRRAILAALRGWKSRDIAGQVAELCKAEESYFTEAEALRLVGASAHPLAAQILKAALKKDSWNDILRIAALDGLVMMRPADIVPLLLQYTKLGHNHRLRMAAIRGLAATGAGIEAVQDRLIELTQDGFLLVRISAVRALSDIGDERAVPALKKLTGDLDGRLIRLAEEAVEKLMKNVE